MGVGRKRSSNLCPSSATSQEFCITYLADLPSHPFVWVLVSPFSI